MNSEKIILDLCGGTGSWSAPYKANGYDVRVITLPEYDLLERTTIEGGEIVFTKRDGSTERVEARTVYGILYRRKLRPPRYPRVYRKSDYQENVRGRAHFAEVQDFPRPRQFQVCG